MTQGCTQKALEILPTTRGVEVSEKISKKVSDLSKTQREYVLRKQLEAIRKELNVGVEDDDVLAELRKTGISRHV